MVAGVASVAVVVGADTKVLVVSALEVLVQAAPIRARTSPRPSRLSAGRAM